MEAPAPWGLGQVRSDRPFERVFPKKLQVRIPMMGVPEILVAAFPDEKFLRAPSRNKNLPVAEKEKDSISLLVTQA